jgi:glycosyltransferase involved in cell wall biosynthesis
MLDGRYLGPSPSGVGRYCREVVAAMQRQDPEVGWQFVVRHRGDESPLVSTRRVEFDSGAYGPRTSLALGRRVGREPAELFHSPFHVLPRGLTCATVVTMHDDFNFIQHRTSNYRFPVNYVEWAYFLLAVPDSLRRATRIVCVSRSTADALTRRMPEMRDKLRVIHHGVAEHFRVLAEDEVAPTCQRLVGQEPFLLSIGPISPNKNHEAMLRAFAGAFDRRGPKLVRISRFGDTTGLARTARALGVADRVVALERPTDEEVLRLMNGAAGLAFCSTIEGFGMPVLEAMACGCPVLTSNVSSLPEVAGEAALYCDPFDTDSIAAGMKKLIGDASLRDDLRARGFERIEQFTWERSAALHREVYREALDA